MPITQTEPAQYSQDSQLDSDQDFIITTVNPNVESTRLDGAHSHPQDSHVPHHTKPRHQLSISVLNDIDTFNGKQGHKLDDWLADVENAAAIVEEDEVVVAKGKARGLA